MVTDANDWAELRADITFSRTTQDTPLNTNDGFVLHVAGNQDMEGTLGFYDSTDAPALFDLLNDPAKDVIVGAEWGGGGTATQPGNRWIAGEFRAFDDQLTNQPGANFALQYTLRLRGKFKRGRNA